MSLIDVYIHEVTRRLPEKSREDIALELQSTIEDMLPDNYTEQDVESVLSTLGSPVTLANGYRDRPMHLIGPRYFDMYVCMLKMIIPIAVTISFIVLMATKIFTYGGEASVITIIINIITEGILNILYVGSQAFFWITLTFAIADRVDKGKSQTPLTTSLKEWTIEDLKSIPFIPKEKAISSIEVFGSLLWTAIWATVYFNANNLLGIYERGPMLVTPTFNQEILLTFWPFIITVIGFEVGLAIYKWFIGKWTQKLALINTLYHIVSSAVFIVVLCHPDLFNALFLEQLTKLIGITFDLKTAIVLGSIIIFIVFAVIEVYQGFRKAKIKSKKKIA